MALLIACRCVQERPAGGEPLDFPTLRNRAGMLRNKMENFVRQLAEKCDARSPPLPPLKVSTGSLAPPEAPSGVLLSVLGFARDRALCLRH